MQVARRPLPSWSACEVCHIHRPPGSHHCRTCDVCTRDFDHHCGALGTCIASGNRKIFILLLAASAVANLVIGGVSGLAAWQWVTRRAPAGTFPLGPALSWQFVATFFPGLVIFPAVGLCMLGFCGIQLLCLAQGRAMHTVVAAPGKRPAE
mmetsp:Transcript_32060/g.106129  ORF Transcript_32060/g.106129 Transcript_32060/m.106129 type:complete len:151 (+) Transcript_32060:103-555(+)